MEVVVGVVVVGEKRRAGGETASSSSMVWRPPRDMKKGAELVSRGTARSKSRRLKR